MRTERDLDALRAHRHRSPTPPCVAPPRIAELEARIRADPRSTPEQLRFLDGIDARRALLEHLRTAHDRVFRTSYVSTEELQQVHRVLDETERER